MSYSQQAPDFVDPGAGGMISNVTACEQYWKIVNNPLYLLVTLPQLVSPVICLFLIVAFAFRFFKRGNFHPNAKILVACQLIFTTMYCCVFVFTHGQLSKNLIFDRDNVCSIAYYAEDCVVAYYAIVTSVTGMCATQVCIGVERIVSSLYITTYEKFGITLGVALACCAGAIPAAACLIVLSEFRPNEERQTCMGVPASAGNKANILYYGIIVCDVFTMILFVITWKINNKMNRESSHDPLPVKYQKRENKNLIKMLLPNLIAHIIVYCGFSISAAIIRSNVDRIDKTIYNIVAVAINCVPHYTVVEFSTLHLVLSKQIRKNQEFQRRLSEHQREQEKDIYFETYTKCWQ